MRHASAARERDGTFPLSHLSTFPLARSVVALALVVNLGVLGVFKYYNFFLDNAVALLNALLGNAAPSSISLWAGVVSFSFQIYGDFSGYSGIAIGCSKLFASPLASDYPDRNNPFVYQRISSVAEKIRSMGIEYYDCRASCPDDKFRDAGHLLRSASYEFTKKFYAEVLKLPVGE